MALTVSVSVESLNTMPVANRESVAIWSRYVTASAAFDQRMMGVISTSTALAAGYTGAGVAGAGMAVTNVKASENAPTPAVFFPRTRQ